MCARRDLFEDRLVQLGHHDIGGEPFAHAGFIPLQGEPFEPEEDLAAQVFLVADAPTDHERLGAVMRHHGRHVAHLLEIVGEADGVEVGRVDGGAAHDRAHAFEQLARAIQRDGQRRARRHAGEPTQGEFRGARRCGDVDDLDRLAVARELGPGLADLILGVRATFVLDRDQVDVMDRRDALDQVVGALKTPALGWVGNEMGEPQYVATIHENPGN
jgi:hypothetical protein